MQKDYSDFKYALEVWFALTQSLSKTQEKLLILSAYINCSDKIDTDNITENFFNITMQSLYESVIMDFARFFDKDVMGDNENCSMRQLKELCIQNKHFSDNRDNVIKDLESIGIEYIDLIKRINYLRDKHFAHNDLQDIFEYNIDYPTIGELIELEQMIHKSLSQISEKLIGAEFSCQDFSKASEKYVSFFEMHIKF